MGLARVAAPMVALAAGMTVLVPLTQALVARIDLADAPMILPHRWRAQRIGRTWYAFRSVSRGGEGMHNLVLGLVNQGHSLTVDHINGDGLDNRRSNLRLATKAEQGANSGPRPGTSRFKGVSWNAREQRWRMAIRVGGVQTSRHFADEREAAAAYNVLARRAWGAFAWVNDV